MRIDSLRAAGLCLLALFTADVSAHGLVQDPPARNWFCGAVTKPDQVQNGVAYAQGEVADEQLAALLGRIWGSRGDRYSELRSAETRDRPRVEMSHIGG